MKVLFLDIDGVLNSSRSCIAFNGYPWPDCDWNKFDDVAVGLLREAIRLTGAVCVLSSSWRVGMEDKEIGDLSVRLGVPIIGKTRSSYGSEKRGIQIQDWLNEHQEVSRYVIVDDDSDMTREQKRFFVKVDPDAGLSYENYHKILRILEG